MGLFLGFILFKDAKQTEIMKILVWWSIENMVIRICFLTGFGLYVGLKKFFNEKSE